METKDLTVTIPERRVGPDWLFGSETRLLNPWAPGVEHILLRALHLPEGAARVTLGPGTTPWRPKGFTRRLSRLGLARSPAVRDAPGVLFDVRWDSSYNFAHLFLNQMARVFFAMEAAGIDRAEDVTVIASEDASPFFMDAFGLAGFELLKTDAPVRGDLLAVDVVRREYVRSCAPRLFERFLRPRVREVEGAPRRIFYARRGGRGVVNQDEVAEILKRRGYEALYPEDHPVHDQVAFFLTAEHVAAVHGAALGPLTVRGENGAPQVLELFGAGYISTAWRFLTRITGGRWVGVRGHVQPEDLALDRPDAGPRDRQAASFRIGPRALKAALALLHDGGGDDWSAIDLPPPITYRG